MSAILEPPATHVAKWVADAAHSDACLAALLERPELRARVSRLSVAACEALVEKGLVDERTELIRGVLLKKMPKSPLHRKLTKWIYDHCRDQRLSGRVVFQEAPLRLADSLPEPDVMIVRGNEADFNTRHPTTAELVVEIAISSVELDREKAALYAEAGVPEYWIVLGEERQLEVHRQPENGVYQQKHLHAVGETLPCGSVPGLQVALDDWFA